MGKSKFTAKQIKILLKNKNVDKCSDKAITYNKEFKIRAVKQYCDEGWSARQIFKEAGLDVNLVGKSIAKNCVMDWIKIYKIRGIEGLLTETRGKYGGRPKTKGVTNEYKIKRLEAQVAYLKAENDFLAKLRAKRAE